MAGESSALLYGYDFYHLWTAGWLARQGLNPYDYTTYSHKLYEIGWPAGEGIQVITHPPLNFWLYESFSLLPFHLALIAWTTLQCLILITALTCFWRAEKSKNPLSQFLFFIVMFTPLIGELLYGQVNILLLSGILLFEILLSARPFLAGAALSLTLLKPHLLIPFYILIAIQIFRTRNYSLGIGGIFGGLLQFGLSLIIFPRGWEYYQNNLSHIISARLPGASLIQSFSSYYDSNIPMIIISFIGILTAIYIGFLSKASYISKRTFMLPFSLVCAPYVWNHSFIVLLPQYLKIMLRTAMHNSKLADWITILLGLLGVAAMVRLEWFGPWWALFPIVLCCFTFYKAAKGAEI